MKFTAWSIALLLGCGPSQPQSKHSGSVSKAEHAEPVADVPLPPAEIARSEVKLDLPVVPAFELPPPHADGTHSVEALRVRGKRVLDSTIAVRGFITAIYDCAADIAAPGEDRKAVQKRIDNDPSLCERPKFFLGERPDLAVEKSLRVVNVPRPYFTIEMKRLPKEEITSPPPDRCKPGDKVRCPQFAVGDEVIVTGEWTLRSPHGEYNSDGLLVYQHLQNVTRRWRSPHVAPSAVAPSPAAPPASATPLAGAKPPPPKPARVTRDVVDRTKTTVADGESALERRQYDIAAKKFHAAIRAWPDHHRAWYGIAMVHAARAEWQAAIHAAERAVALRPDGAMYQLAVAWALFERAVVEARAATASKTARTFEEVVDVDLSNVDFERAMKHAHEALRLEPQLWRAHYLLGRIHRAGDRPKEAAEAFSKSIAAASPWGKPFVALAELYRQWNYTDAAMKVAEAGLIAVADDRADLHYLLAVNASDLSHFDKAVESFTYVLSIRKDDARALFGRAQAQYRKGDFVNAKRDLETFAKHPTHEMALEKQQATRMLADIEAKARGR